MWLRMAMSCTSDSMSDYYYFLLFKPFGYLSQFSREVPEHKVLGDLYHFPEDVYPVGRLDADSEGLLILTNDKKLNAKLLSPEKGHWRTYLIQVEGNPMDADLEKLRTGIHLTIRKKIHRCKPARVKLIKPPEVLPERDPPIRYRKNIADCWIEISLQEGKNRQERKMMAAIGFPVLRLVRISIETLSLSKQIPGRVEQLQGKEIYQKLKIQR